jgi:hypothetical protein
MWSLSAPLTEAGTAAQIVEAVLAERSAGSEHCRRICRAIQAKRLRARKIWDEHLEFTFGSRRRVEAHRLSGRVTEGFDVPVRGIMDRAMVEQLSVAIANL